MTWLSPEEVVRHVPCLLDERGVFLSLGHGVERDHEGHTRDEKRRTKHPHGDAGDLAPRASQEALHPPEFWQVQR